MSPKRKPTLLLASGNPGKLQELKALLQHLELDLLDPRHLAATLSVLETGRDYTANASLKARAYAEASGFWTLADDSGLEVAALEGAPGVRSARLAGPGRSDEERRRVLLSQLRGHPRPWAARFCCAVALASPDGRIDSAIGECPGEIIPQERGSRGFGYDPIFVVAGTQCTMAELSLEEKNQLSHRARALQTLLPVMKRRLKIK
jgi:XTP/dITP diphosphohydrolase